MSHPRRQRTPQISNSCTTISTQLLDCFCTQFYEGIQNYWLPFTEFHFCNRKVLKAVTTLLEGIKTSTSICKFGRSQHYPVNSVLLRHTRPKYILLRKITHCIIIYTETWGFNHSEILDLADTNSSQTKSTARITFITKDLLVVVLKK